MKILYSILLALTLSASVSATPITSQVITVSGTDYTIGWMTGTFAEVNTAHNLTDEPWWGLTVTGVSAFAEALGFDGFSEPGAYPEDGEMDGPRFAHVHSDPLFVYQVRWGIFYGDPAEAGTSTV